MYCDVSRYNYGHKMMRSNSWQDSSSAPAFERVVAHVPGLPFAFCRLAQFPSSSAPPPASGTFLPPLSDERLHSPFQRFLCFASFLFHDFALLFGWGTWCCTYNITNVIHSISWHNSNANRALPPVQLLM